MENDNLANYKMPINRKPLFEYEGRLDDWEGYDKFDDENINSAVELRLGRSKHSDFFFKLHELKERIDVYNEVFRSKKPKYLRRQTI